MGRGRPTFLQLIPAGGQGAHTGRSCSPKQLLQSLARGTQTVEEGTTRRGTDTLVHRLEKPADSKHAVI